MNTFIEKVNNYFIKSDFCHFIFPMILILSLLSIKKAPKLEFIPTINEDQIILNTTSMDVAVSFEEYAEILTTEENEWVDTAGMVIPDQIKFLQPYPSLVFLYIRNFTSYTIERGDFVVLPNLNKDCELKIRTPPKTNQLSYQGYVNMAFPPAYIYDDNHGVKSIELNYIQITNQTEADALIYLDGITIPTITSTCGGKHRCVKKTKAIDVNDYEGLDMINIPTADYWYPGKKLKADTYSMVYFELTPRNPDEYLLKIEKKENPVTIEAKEVGNFVTTCEDNKLSISGDVSEDGTTTDVQLSLKPNEKIKKLEIKQLAGTLNIERKDFVVNLDNNKDLLVKIKTPVKSEKVEVDGISASFPPFSFINGELGASSVEIEFTDLKDQKEADVALHYEGQELPGFKADSSKAKCILKSKEVRASDYFPQSANINKKLMLSYCEFEKENKGLSAGAIAGIVTGCIIFIILIILLILYIMNKFKSEEQINDTP